MAPAFSGFFASPVQTGVSLIIGKQEFFKEREESRREALSLMDGAQSSREWKLSPREGFPPPPTPTETR